MFFSLLRLMPEEGYLGAAADKMSPAQQEIYLTNLGLRDPLLIQLGNFYTKLLQGDLGKSVTYRTDVPVTTIIGDKIIYSLLFWFRSCCPFTLNWCAARYYDGLS
ncbi:hypothetical protein OL548_17690 [Lysinibacillus sp. MHQ-1]|nr:hypothetical protein OL548_17690 [Lysinibacillus sp. MHQ-1]